MDTNVFSSWIKEHFYPTAIVSSTQKSRNILLKNSLTPSEFLRPFGLFNELIINQNEKFNTTLRNFRLDFYDADKYTQLSFDNFKPIIEVILKHKYIEPEWTLNEIMLTKDNPDVYLSKLQNYSLPWYQEYENVALELMRFYKYEQYQQPLLYVYVVSLDDDAKAINYFQNMPLLVNDGVYSKKLPNVVIVLHDQMEPLPQKKKDDNLAAFKQKFGNVLLWNINSYDPKATGQQLDDIWRTYIHYYDSYNLPDNIIRGTYISKDERVNFRTSLQKYMNTVAVRQITELMNVYEIELQQKKKGIKNTFLNFVKKQEQPEYCQHLNIYKFTDIEAKAYLLGLLQFYFRNYEGAYDSFSCIYKDIKSKSKHHSHILQELMHVCYYLNYGEIKESEYLSPYNFFVKNHMYTLALRSVFIVIKMLEQSRRFKDIPNIMRNALRDIPIREDRKISKSDECVYYLQPILLEKISAYYLINPISFREFYKYIIMAGWKYSSTPFTKYALHCLGQVFPFINQRTHSFVALKHFINQKMGELCKDKVNYQEGGLKFYKNCIELSKFTKKAIKAQYDDMTACLYTILNSPENNNSSLGVMNVHDLKVPEVDNSTLLILEEQDYIIAEDFKNYKYAEYKGWKRFYKYHIIPLKPIYLSLSINDITSLRNLDDIISAKQNFSNFYSKRNFKGNINNKMYVRFTINNPVDCAFNITNMKLICDFIPLTTSDNGDNNSSSSSGDIELQNLQIYLKQHTTRIVELYCKPLTPGTCIVKGVQITLDGVSVIKHYFNVKNVSKLYNYRVKRLGSIDGRKSSMGRDSLQSGSRTSIPGNTPTPNTPMHSRSNFNKKADITFEIKDNNADVTVTFPMGTSLTVYQHQLLLMPITITNNSDARIKRFCLFFEEEMAGVPSLESSSIKTEANSVLCDYIYKEIELINNTNKNAITVYVPIVPRKQGDMYVKILIKFEEDTPFKDNEVKRYIIKLNINKSIVFDIDERLLKYTSNEHDSDIKNMLFALDTMAYINDTTMFKELSIGEHIYTSNTFIRKDTTNTWDVVENDTFHKMYHKFKYACAINEGEKKGKSVKQKETEMIVKETVFDFVPEHIRSDPQQSHIVHRLAQLLVHNRFMFTWKCAHTKTNTDVSGIVFHEASLQKPNTSLKFLKSLLKNTCTVTPVVTKVDNNVSAIALNFVLKRRSLTELRNITSYEIFVKNEDPEIKWYGMLNTKVDNTYCKKGDKTDVVSLTFVCLCTKKGRFNVNRIGIAFKMKEHNGSAGNDIVLYNPPEQLMITVE